MKSAFPTSDMGALADSSGSPVHITADEVYIGRFNGVPVYASVSMAVPGDPSGASGWARAKTWTPGDPADEMWHQAECYASAAMSIDAREQKKMMNARPIETGFDDLGDHHEPPKTRWTHTAIVVGVILFSVGAFVGAVVRGLMARMP